MLHTLSFSCRTKQSTSLLSILSSNNNYNMNKLLCKCFSAKNKRKFESKNISKPEDDSSLIEFQHLLRLFYKKSHPDLLRSSNPEYANLNDNSMQELNGILTIAKQYNEFSARMVKNVPFYIKNNDKIDFINLRIVTSGGHFKNPLTTSFEDFFIAAGD